MTTLFESSNYLQQKLVQEGLRMYRARLLYDKPSASVEQIRKNMGTIILERGAPRRGRAGQEDSLAGLEQRVGKELQSGLEKLSDNIVEIIINQYNGHTEILIPVKTEDLNRKKEDTLSDKLYTACEEVCSVHQGEEFSFDGYVGFSIMGKMDKVKLAQELLAAAPGELGGTSSKGTKFYLRVAYNFCFNYVPEEAGKKETPSNQVLTREDAVKYFEQGKNALELSQMYPLTKKMTLAGW
ncbi:MAG: hypothetical protein AABY26_05940, partial [Nanoarchaeota archaeon]